MCCKALREVREDSDKRTNIPHKLQEKKDGEHTPCNAQESTRGVSHCGLAIYINKYVKAKEEL